MRNRWWPVVFALMAGCTQEATIAPMADRPTRLRNDVTMLAETIGERNTRMSAALERAAVWIEGRLAKHGAVTREPYLAAGTQVRNVYVDVRGTTSPDELVVIGAHYDTVGHCPGANDNGSGVAGLLDLADALAGKPHARTIRFVAFVNEEPPFFQTGSMGSLVHARACKDRDEKIVAMIALETIGCFSDKRGSQQYPIGAPPGLPTVGDFIGVVGDLKSKPLNDRVAASMAATKLIPVQPASLPDLVPGVGWSDHWSFWQAGYPAVMLTDTAPFRYADYHYPTDTPDKLDYARMAKVIDAAEAAIVDLADR